jgi:hypothetical protein
VDYALFLFTAFAPDFRRRFDDPFLNNFLRFLVGNGSLPGRPSPSIFVNEPTDHSNLYYGFSARLADCEAEKRSLVAVERCDFHTGIFPLIRMMPGVVNVLV